jgi:hypothetical protein
MLYRSLGAELLEQKRCQVQDAEDLGPGLLASATFPFPSIFFRFVKFVTCVTAVFLQECCHKVGLEESVNMPPALVEGIK